jgi:hypothetical protein
MSNQHAESPNCRMRHYENLKLKKQYTWSRVFKNTLEVSMLNRNTLQLKVLSTTRCVADTVGSTSCFLLSQTHT